MSGCFALISHNTMNLSSKLHTGNFYSICDWTNQKKYLILLSWKLFIKTTDSEKLLCTVEPTEPCSLCSDKWLCVKALISVCVGPYAWINLTTFLCFLCLYFHFYAPEFIHLYSWGSNSSMWDNFRNTNYHVIWKVWWF